MGVIDSYPEKWLPVDPISGNRLIIEPEHGAIHDGVHFTLDYYKELVSVGSTSTVMFTSPATATSQFIHFVCGVEADKAIDWYLHEGTTASGGSAITAYNNHRTSTNTNPVTIVANPIVTSNGTILEQHIAGSASTPQSNTGGGVVARNEWLLKPATNYLIRVVGTVATTKSVINAPYYYRT
jgi:hypothetical protein